MFSIVIPSLNEWYYLNITLDSIYNYVDLELLKDIVIVDDASDKEDYKFLENHLLKDKIKLIKNEYRKGPSYSRNKGAENALWEILIFLDSHMYCYNLDLQKLKSLRSYIDKWALQWTIWDLSNKQVKWQVYKIKNYLLNSTWDVPKKEEDIVETPAIAGWFTIISKDIFEKIWWFNSKFNSWGVEDIEISFRLWTFGYNMYYTKKVWVAHYFKKSFNYDVDAKDVFYNKYLTYKIYFENTFSKSDKVFKVLEEYYWIDIVKDTKNKVEKDEELLRFVEEFKLKQTRNIDSYFLKFNNYYDKI